MITRRFCSRGRKLVRAQAIGRIVIAGHKQLLRGTSVMKRLFAQFTTLLLVSASVLALGQKRPPVPPPNYDADSQKRSFTLSGRVVLDDGTPPPERVAIERVCPNQTRREAFTDSNGAYRFVLGADSGAFQDATISSSFEGFRNPNTEIPPEPSAVGAQEKSLSLREAVRCSLRGVLPGFRSDSVSLGNLQMADVSALPPIVLHRMSKPPGPRVSATTLQAPPDAVAAYDKARQMIAKGQALRAVAELRKAIQLHPKYAEALVQLGEIYAQQGLSDEAERLFMQAIAADAAFSPAYFDLAPIAGEKGDWKQMAMLSEKGLALDSRYAAGNYFNALACYHLGDLRKAETSARAARRLDPNHTVPNVELLLANILVRRNDVAGAIEQLRAFLEFSAACPEAPQAREWLAKLESKPAQK